MNIKKSYKINYKLLIIMLIFFIISLLSLYSADIINTGVNNIMYKQLIWIIIGFLLIKIINNIGNNTIIKYSFVLYIIMNILLLLLLLFAPTINNAKCWFKIPGIGTVQPSEFMKITLIIFLANYINNYKINHKFLTIKEEITFLFKILIIVLIPSILTFLEPDTGAVFMYLVLTISILFISKIRIRWFIGGLSILSILILITLYLYNNNINLFIKLLGNSFFLRVERLINWSNTSGMQLERGIASIGSSGLLGNGFSKNVIYFPEAHTDFIFAVFSSNFGFIGSLSLIILIIMFDLEIINIAKNSKNRINKYICIGILGILLYQQIQNIGMTFGLLPITGITLPFISYGGSSLLSYMIMMGIIFNIYSENKKSHY